MTFLHGMEFSNNQQLREQLEIAHNSAYDKWGAYLSDLALAYWDSYNMVSGTLDKISAFKKTKAQQAELFWTVVLPAVAGGFLGGIVSLRLKAVLQESGIKFVEHSLLVDTGKTVTSDLAKYTTKQIEAACQEAADTNPWKPSSPEPGKFAETLKNDLLHAMASMKDALIAAQKKSAQEYRNQMLVFYNSPFIWNAPEEQDMQRWKANLWRPLEVFLWADWANHRDTQYWIKRIMAATDGRGNYDYAEELYEFNPILARLEKCDVPRQYVTQTAVTSRHLVGDNANYPAEGLPFLNILWVRHLASHYQNTFLGELLNRIPPGGAPTQTWPVNLSQRVGRYRLM